METKNCDVVIIGAGMAGISAARTLEQNNRQGGVPPVSYAVLEAGNKIGGRVQSIEVPERGVIINPGAQWFHRDVRPGSAENHLAELAKSYGLRMVRDTMPRDYWDQGRRRNYSSNTNLINQARRLIDQYGGPDVDLATLFANQNFGNALSLVTTFGEVETGAPLHQVSTVDVRELVACNRGDFLLDGMGQFVQRYAQDVLPQISTGTAVKKIVWQFADTEKTGVEIHTTNGEIYHAKQCILTASIGVLRSGLIEFEPALPPAHQESLNHVTMGNFNKVFLMFDRGFRFPVNSNTHMDVRTRAGEDIFYLARDNGQPLVTTFLGGELARLCDSDPDRAESMAMRGLAEIWGENVRRHIVQAHTTQWGNEPYVLGGYSRVDIGHHGARDALAAPIGDVLRLAGEALGARHPETGRYWATHKAGAAISGERAASEVLQALGVAQGAAAAPGTSRAGYRGRIENSRQTAREGGPPPFP